MLQNILTKIIVTRIEKKFSQRYMAARLNISQSYYNKLENSKHQMTIKTLLEIAQILNVETTELFTPIKKPNPSNINQTATPDYAVHSQSTVEGPKTSNQFTNINL